MKSKTVVGRWFSEGIQKAFFRMRKKNREKIQLERYSRTMAYIAGEDDYETDLMIETLKSVIKERNEAMMAAAGGNKMNENCLVL
ncbi:hypothetical protein L3C95_28645 [Chitinophaga filiformis]|uniref:hypothetical protein n=1 Tax=Chitinophaga filiformis TaxID=104663 RepID=UPI001F289201|nr:hypothetical protein [Chitinophaga filiformis]MCF6406902.1 hypothetical protein [Chitinophaga filiformis]